LYRLKLKSIVDSQEYRDILERPENDDLFMGDYDENVTYVVGETVKYQGVLYEVIQETTGNLPTDTNFWREYQDNTLRDLLSTYEKEMQINNAVLSEAEADAPKSGYDVSHYYTVDVDDRGNATVNTVEDPTASAPEKMGYAGYLVSNGEPPNGAAFGSGIKFPAENDAGDYFLRTDYLPNRLFKFDGQRWLRMYDDVRMTMTNTSERKTQLTSFINNNAVSEIGGEQVTEKQALSKALRPKADDT
jgi:hypothetical protein